MFDKNKLKASLTAALEQGKGKAKFKQSVELAINFKDVDFKKPENRLNADVTLPYVAKPIKVAIFADGQLAINAKGLVDKIYTPTDIDKLAADKKQVRELTEYSLLAQTSLMAQIGKSLGQALGAAGKLPKPVMPNADLKDLVERTKRSVNVKTKGKYLPTVHALIGKEDMPVEQLYENLMAVLEAVNKKIPETQINTMYVKTTMGPAVKV